MMQNITWSLLAAVSMLGFTAPALAADPPFARCDGYGTPTADGDGMTREATVLGGLFGAMGSAGNTSRITPTLGREGIALCDAALADARLLDRFWLRRSSLLRARAIHRLAGGDAATALADLKLAEAAVRQPQDPFYRRSMAVGIALVRGYALRKQGDSGQASALVEQTLASRPYDRQTLLAGLAATGEAKAADRLLQAIARLDPRSIDSLAIRAFETRDFPEYVRLAGQLRAPVPTISRGDGPVAELDAMTRNRAMTIIFDAERKGRLAYALAALGRADEARATITAAKARIAQAVPAPLPVAPEGVKLKRKEREERVRNTLLIGAGSEASGYLASWEQMVDARSALATTASASALRFPDRKTPSLAAAADFLSAAVERFPETKSELGPQVVQVEQGARATLAAMTDDLTLLFNGLPHAEIEDRIADYRKARSGVAGFFAGSTNGFRVSEGEAGPTISFTGTKSSGSVVEELALLRSAQLTQERGKTGFVVLARRDFQRITHTTYYGATLRSDPHGHTTELDIELVDAAAPPQHYAAVPWRVLTAAQVVAALGPTYYPTATSQVSAR